MGGLFSGPKVNATPPPTDEETLKEAKKRAGRISRSKEAFLQRQSQLGPVQLQAAALGGIRPRT